LALEPLSTKELGFFSTLASTSFLTQSSKPFAIQLSTLTFSSMYLELFAEWGHRIEELEIHTEEMVDHIVELGKGFEAGVLVLYKNHSVLVLHKNLMVLVLHKSLMVLVLHKSLMVLVLHKSLMVLVLHMN
jgi:hypothetical protein